MLAPLRILDVAELTLSKLECDELMLRKLDVAELKLRKLYGDKLTLRIRWLMLS